MDDIFGFAIRLSRLGQGGGDELFHHGGERAAFRLGAAGEVFHQLGIEAARLAAGSMQAATGVEVCMGDHELARHGFATQQVEEEGFTGTEIANDQPETGADFGDAIEALIECRNFGVAPNLNMAGAGARGDA